MADQSDQKWYSHLMMVYDIMMMMYGLSICDSAQLEEEARTGWSGGRD